MRAADRCDVKRNYRLPNGENVTGEEVDFEPEKEGFNVYLLADGTKLRVKNVLSQVIRLDSWGPDGNPLYLLSGGQVVAADVPDQLKRRAE